MGSVTESIPNGAIPERPQLHGDAVHDLLEALQTQQTKPLWTQMAKLNPSLPNPTAIPHVWRYDDIRPHLLRAGELITEKQAERRVLMLVNPARGNLKCSKTITKLSLSMVHSGSVYHGYHLRRSAAGDAE
jgi:gentisate 1,2-dioxygenase